MSSIVDKLGYALESLKDVGSDIVNGDQVLASPDVTLKRLETCGSCDKFISKIKLCSVCGCLMICKAKLNGTRCPLDKWTKL